MVVLRFVFASLLALVIPLSLSAQSRPQTRPGVSGRIPISAPPYLQYAKSREETPTLTKVVFKNGLTVLVHEFRNAPVVSIVAQVSIGFAHEPEAQVGITHALVRCLLQGTRNRAPGVFAKEIRTMGAALRHSIDFERTSYRLDAPSAQWKKALELQSDVFLNPLLDPEKVAEEIGEIVLEIGQTTVDSSGQRDLRKLVFPDHPLGRSTLGREESLRAITRESLLEYHRDFFTLDRLVLIVAGDVVTTDVLNEAARLYGKARTPAGKSIPALRIAEQQEFRRLEIRDPVPLPRVLAGFPARGANIDDLYALEIVTALLGEGRGSVLHRRLQEEKKLVRSASASLDLLPGTGLLRITMEVDPADIDRAELALLTEIEMLKRREPLEHEFERAIAILERRHWERLQSILGRAEALGYYEVNGGWKRMNEVVARLRRVKPADVVRAAKRYLSLENCSIIEQLPEESEREIPTEVVLKTLGDLLEPSVGQEMASRERETIAAFDFNRDTADFKYSEVRFPIQKSSIWRGPELFIKEDHTVPVVTVGLFFAGGKILENPSNNGITRLLLHSILRGGKKDEEMDLQIQLEIYGARIVPVVREDYFGLQFSILSRNIEQGLSLLLTLIKNPKIDAETLERAKPIQIARLRQETIHDRLLRRAVFGDFPYGLGARGTEESVSSLTPEAVRAWYQSLIENKKPIIVIIGDTQGTSLAGYFVRSFSGSRFQDLELPSALPKEVEKRAQLETDSDAPESKVMLGFLAPPYGDEDLAVVRVLVNYLSGPGGKLHDELVEQRKIARSVDLCYEPSLRAGAIVASMTAARADEEKAIEAFDEEIRKVWENPLLYKDYRLAINSAIGEHWLRQQSREAQIDALVEVFLAGKTPESILNFIADVQAVREEDLQEVARRLLSPESATVLRVHARGSKPSSEGGPSLEPPPD